LSYSTPRVTCDTGLNTSSDHLHFLTGGEKNMQNLLSI
jgi:hypothetical protein